jgi:hypothetical protein
MRPYFNEKLGLVVHACHTSYGGTHNIGGLLFRLAWAKANPISKITRAKKD